MDKNNLPLTLSRPPFVSPRPPHTMALCVGAAPGQPGPLPSAANGTPESRAGARRGRGPGRPSVAVGCHSEVPTQRGEPREENKQSKESWKMLSPPAGGIALAARCSAPGLCPPAAATAGGGLGAQSLSRGGGRETGAPVSAHQASRVLTLHAEVFPLSEGADRGEGGARCGAGSQRRERKTLLSCRPRFTESSYSQHTARPAPSPPWEVSTPIPISWTKKLRHREVT